MLRHAPKALVVTCVRGSQTFKKPTTQLLIIKCGSIKQENSDGSVTFAPILPGTEPAIVEFGQEGMKIVGVSTPVDAPTE